MSEILRNDKDKKDRQMSSCEKIRSVEYVQRKKSLLKLKQQESLMERNLINLTLSMRLNSESLRLILQDANSISRKREILLSNIKRSLEEITEEFKLMKSIMNCPEQIQKLDINTYKQRLVRLSEKIEDFQESCQLELLSQEQIALESELHEFELHLQKYDNANDNVGKLTCAFSNKEKKKCHDYKEVENFQTLIAKTGHTGNWSDEDHLLFIKMRKKCSNIPALVSTIRIKCPDLTVENIVNHEAWYKVYLSLRDKQRSEVKEWRKQKEMEKTRKTREDETIMEISEEVLRLKTNSNTIGKIPICMTNKFERKTIRTANDDVVNVDSANQKKELIRRWKLEKESKRLMEEEQSKILIKTKLIRQEKCKMEKLKKIQQALAEYHKRKLTKISSQSSRDNSKTKQKYNLALVQAFRKQDEEYVRKKRNLIAKLQRPTKSQAVKLVKSGVATSRDYSTLLNSTKVWTERCKKQENVNKGPKKLQYIKDIPHLCNQWRNMDSTEIKEVLTFPVNE